MMKAVYRYFKIQGTCTVPRGVMGVCHVGVFSRIQLFYSLLDSWMKVAKFRVLLT